MQLMTGKAECHVNGEQTQTNTGLSWNLESQTAQGFHRCGCGKGDFASEVLWECLPSGIDL
jgi:hypothetical protein